MGAAIGSHMRSEVYGTIKRAMESRKNVRATYDGFEREFSPHTLGTKGREERVLGYQIRRAKRCRSRTGRLRRELEVLL